MPQAGITKEATATGNKLTWSQRLVMIIALGLCIVMLGGAQLAGTNFQPFDLEYSPNAILPLAAAITNIAVFIFLTRRFGNRSDDVMWFSLQVACLTIWSIAEVFKKLSGSPDTFMVWAAISSLGSFFMPVTFYMFALAYTQPRQSKHAPTIIFLAFTAMLMIFTEYRTDMLTPYVASGVSETVWGMVLKIGPYYAVEVLWITLIYTLSLIMFARFRRHTVEPTLRRQATLFMIAPAIPLLGGLITDGILPIFQITDMIPLGVPLTTIMGLIIGYGILRYRFFSFTPLTVASNVIETMNEAVIGLKPNLSINYVNAGAERLLGYKPQQFIKLSFTHFLTQKWDHTLLKQTLFGPLEHQAYSQIDSLDLKTAEGQFITAKASISRVVEDGQVQGYLMVLTDITAIAQAKQIIENTVKERTRELSQTQAQLTASIRSLPFGFGLVNLENEVLFTNALLPKLLGQSIPEDFQKSSQAMHEIAERFHPAIDILEDISATHTKGTAVERNFMLGTRYYRFLFMPILETKSGNRKPKSVGTVLLVEDTTEAKTLERSRGEFFSIASHELRTPLTAIRGNASMMLDYYSDEIKNPEVREMIAGVHASSIRLISIVSDFLDMSRLETGQLMFKSQPFNASELIRGLIKENQPSDTAHYKLQLGHTGPDLWAAADPERTLQILNNLLRNAIKATQQGEITVSLSTAGHRLKISVSDTGKGIAEKDQHLLFHKFQQASGSILTREDTQSTGLGLYISQLLAQGMGGKLYLEHTEIGKGSAFALELPLKGELRIKK